MRRPKPDPAPDELIWKLLDAAVKAPSGGNRQPWHFIVIRDAETKAKIAEWYLESWNPAYGPFRQAAMASPATAGTFSSADHLANHLADVPVLIIATVNISGVAPVSPPRASASPPRQHPQPAARAAGGGGPVGGGGGGGAGLLAGRTARRPLQERQQPRHLFLYPFGQAGRHHPDLPPPDGAHFQRAAATGGG